MKQVRHYEQSNGCFAAVGRHPILLTIHAGFVLLAGIHQLGSGPGSPVSLAAPTFAYALNLYLTTALTLSGILLSGIFPGLVMELAATAILGGRLLSPPLGSVYSGIHDDTMCVVLFIRILALLLIGVLAGSSSVQMTQRWAEILARFMDPDEETRTPDEHLPMLSGWKDRIRLFVRGLIRLVMPLSALITGSTVWLM